MNSQNTKAIGGSNCRSFGESRFHPNQMIVQIKTIRKKPMVPTRLVIEQASLSSALNFSEASLLTFRSGFRCFLNSSSESGFRNFSVDVSLIAKLLPHDSRNYSVGLSDIPPRRALLADRARDKPRPRAPQSFSRVVSTWKRCNTR